MGQGWGPRRAAPDPGAARGVVAVPTVGYGACGHLIASHDIRKDKTRGACSHMGPPPEGQCQCKGCPPAEETP